MKRTLEYEMGSQGHPPLINVPITAEATGCELYKCIYAHSGRSVSRQCECTVQLTFTQRFLAGNLLIQRLAQTTYKFCTNF